MSKGGHTLAELNFTSEEDIRIKDAAFSFAAEGLVTPTTTLRAFVKESWPVIEPSLEYLPNWHIDATLEYLEAVALGQILRLNIEMPPRYLKSILATINFPVWMWTTQPWLRFMFVSYSAKLATAHSMKRRDIIRSEWYGRQWGGLVRILPNLDQKAHFGNMSMGEMLSTSIGGAATGFGADIIIIDDPINPEEAESEAERNRARNYVERTLSTRLNDKKRGAIINVAQRTHKNDVTAKLLEGEDYTTLSLPATAPARLVVDFPISKTQKVREEGDVLHAEREDAALLVKQQRKMGTRAYMAQYQQSPSTEEGAIFKAKWWKFYKDEELPKGFDRVVESWDMAFKDLETSSYVSGCALGQRGPNIYVLPEEVHEHLNFPETCKNVATYHGRINPYHACPVVPILVEDKANGPAVVSVMAAKIPGVIAVSPEGSKEARGSAVSPLVESGNVHLPYPYDNAGNVRPERRWVLEWIDEFERFPAEPNDRVDSFSQGVLRLMLQPTEGEQLGATDEHLDFENISDSLGDGVFNNLPGIGGGEEVFLD